MCGARNTATDHYSDPDHLLCPSFLDNTRGGTFAGVLGTAREADTCGPIPLMKPSQTFRLSLHAGNRTSGIAGVPGTFDERISLPANPVLVVVGAHYFGGDANDPLFGAIKGVIWDCVLLVDASPPVTRYLNLTISERRPLNLAKAPGASFRVVNEGICPDVQGEATARPFYWVDPHSRATAWLSQTGSFKFEMVRRAAHLGGIRTHELASRLHHQSVLCGPLLGLLRRHEVVRPSVLLLDLEGFDCTVVQTQDWCVLRPRLLIYEDVHCGGAERRAAATASLARDCGDDWHYQLTRVSQNTVALLVPDARRLRRSNPLR